MMDKSFKPAVAEGLASFVFVCVAGGVICANAMTNEVIGWVGIALANVFAFTALVAFTMHISGGHINPVVTIGHLFAGRIDMRKAATYIVAQLVGATLAGLVLAGVFPNAVWESVKLGAPLLNEQMTVGTAILVEFVFSWFFVMVALACLADDRSQKNFAPLAIGFALGFATLVIGPLTGACVNPARSFGAAIASGFWTNQITYWVGPVLGGICAPFFYRVMGGQIKKAVSAPWEEFDRPVHESEPKVTHRSVEY